MWWGLLSIIIGASIAVMFLRGPVAALGFGVLFSHLFPCWIRQEYFGVSIDLRLSTALILLLVNLFHKKGRISWEFTSGDWALFGLYTAHVASDALHDGLNVSQFCRAFGEWSVPYISGRLAIQNTQDWRWLTGIAAILATVFALWAATEAVTRVNPANQIFGSRPVDRTNPISIRGGFKRAEGPTKHAIWFGMIQALLLPWVVSAAYRGLRADGPTWWIAIPLFSVCGVCCTLSRGPAVAALTVFYLVAVFCLPKARRYLIVAGILLVGFGFFAKEKVLDSLEGLEARQWKATSPGSKKTTARKIEIDGEEHRLTAMSYRWLVIYPYLPAIRQTGFLGFGTERTATFPPNVPFGQDAKQAISRFWSIDCEYLLLLLRFGWIGLVAFVALGGCSIWRILNQSIEVLPDERIFPFGVAATLIAAMLAFVVEWMPHDYGFLFLWLCGVANGPRLQRHRHGDGLAISSLGAKVSRL